MRARVKEIVKSPYFWVLSDQGIYSAYSFLSTLFAARFLGVEDFGLYASLFIAIYFILSITNALVVMPFQVLLPDIEDRSGYISFLLLSLILIISILLSIGYLLNQYPANPFQIPSDLFINFAKLAMVFIIQDFCRKYLIATYKLKSAFLIDLSLILCFGLFILVWIIGGKTDLSGFINYLSLIYLLPITLALFFLRPKGNIILSFRAFTGMQWHQARYLFISVFVQWWSSNLFIVGTGIFLSAKALGIFRLVQSIFGVFNALFQSIENYVIPELSRRLKESNKEVKTYLIRIFKYLTAFAIPVFLLFVIFPEFIITVAGGEEFSGNGFAIQMMALVYILIFSFFPFRILVRVYQLNRSFFIAYSCSLVLSLIFVNPLLSTFGLKGAFIGLMMNQMCLAIYWYFSLKRLNRLK